MNESAITTYQLFHKKNDDGSIAYAYWEIENPPPAKRIKIISPEFQSEKEALEWWDKTKPLDLSKS